MLDFLNNANWQELLQAYGYWAILLGTFLEGETVVLLAGILVSGEQMSFGGVVVCAFVGCVLSDQLMFSLGKYKGRAILARFPKLNRKQKKISLLLQKHDLLMILGFRFIYGVRNITPIILGISRISHWRFFFLNTVGALVWALSFTTAGYYFGHAIDHMLREFGPTFLLVTVGILLLATAAFLHFRKRKQKQSCKPPETAER